MAMHYMFAVGFVLALALSLVTHYKYRISRLRVALYSITFSYGFLGAYLMGRLYGAFLASRGETPASGLAMLGAVIFTPLMELVTIEAERGVCRLLNRGRAKKEKPLIDLTRVDRKDTMDFLAPDVFIVMLCGKIQCHINGCCFGVVWPWGVYSNTMWARVFPVQLFEAGTTGLVLIVCYIIKHTRFYRRGMAFPLTAGLYCIARFGWEFLRYYPDSLRHAVLGLTVWQACCVVVIAASAVSIVLLYKRNPSEPLMTCRQHLASMKSKRKTKDRK